MAWRQAIIWTNKNTIIIIKENYFENVCHFFRSQCVDSLWPSDAIKRHRSGSTLAQVPCWLIIWTLKISIWQVVFEHGDVMKWEYFPYYWPSWRETTGFPSQRPMTRGFVFFFNLHLNKRFGKQLRHRWFERPPCTLWRHYNGRRQWVDKVSLNMYSPLAAPAPCTEAEKTQILQIHNAYRRNTTPPAADMMLMVRD